MRPVAHVRRAGRRIDLKEEAGLMCTASGRVAHCVIYLTIPCTGVILWEEKGAAVRHNDCRHSSRFNFSICSVAASDRNAFVFNVCSGCHCQIKTTHMSHDEINRRSLRSIPTSQIQFGLSRILRFPVKRENPQPSAMELPVSCIVTALQHVKVFRGSLRF